MSIDPNTLTVEYKVHFASAHRGRKKLTTGNAPPPASIIGRIPRVARVMALAIKFDGLLAAGEVRDYADIARLGHVTRARVTQMMNLLALAPDIQEEILFLEAVHIGRDLIMEQQIRPIAGHADWQVQRRHWRALKATRQRH